MTYAKKMLVCLAFCTSVQILPAAAQDQTKTGAGNAMAIELSEKSPMVKTAQRFLIDQAKRIENDAVREQTLAILTKNDLCVEHRAGVNAMKKQALLQELLAAGLADPKDNATIPGGLLAGVFPPLADDGTSCPHLPQKFTSAPGSNFGGHHSYPGGLTIHEAFNELSDLNFANGYRFVYGHPRADGLPVLPPSDLYGEPTKHGDEPPNDLGLSQDVILAAPIWHDWAKTMVFQWNADGTEFQELNFGGNGVTDAFRAAGNSKTGAHHILSIAEAMKRGLPADLVIAQASAHSTPTNGNEYKVVNWLRAGAIVAQIDAVAKGYLVKDAHGNFRLPALRKLGDVNLLEAAPSQPNVLAENVLHNLSDSDYSLTGPAMAVVQILLAKLAPEFGYNSADAANYNNKYRNPVLSFFSAERLLILYSNGGLSAVRGEVQKLRDKKIL